MTTPLLRRIDIYSRGSVVPIETGNIKYIYIGSQPPADDIKDTTLKNTAWIHLENQTSQFFGVNIISSQFGSPGLELPLWIENAHFKSPPIKIKEPGGKEQKISAPSSRKKINDIENGKVPYSIVNQGLYTFHFGSEWIGMAIHFSTKGILPVGAGDLVRITSSGEIIMLKMT